ncbi:type II secretion system protein GspL [uncultured Microbulbifer sp.]|uniref:type II secretion system protein GspL n=1 Tax=uncultured Microbulbifer sp. TaxID=348147 RepID=UPI00263184C3|nr:type II secretion system protein GspL [uncultured Microbulbifer sp.]
MKLLRLREPVAGSHSGDQVQAAGSVLLQCWREGAWQAVATDTAFQRAFIANASEAGYAIPEAESANGEIATEAEGVISALAFEPEDRAVILVPGSWVWNGLENVPRAARRQSTAVGYMVEEQLAEDVEDLHFVCEPVAGDLCSVMAVSSNKLAALKGQIERLGWPVIGAIPEYRVLANTGANSSAVWFDDDRAHFWMATGKGLSVARPLAGVIAESLMIPVDTEEGAEVAGAQVGAEDPSALRVLGDVTELELATFEQLATVERISDAPPEASFSASVGASVPGNLLTGDFQITLASDGGPWWKKPAIAVAACFALQLAFFVGAGVYYKIQADRADDAARTLFSEIFPGDSPGADLRRQIMGYLNQSSGGGGEFAGQLQQLSKVWATGNSGDLKLQSLRFDGNRGELVLQLRAANLGQLDSVVGKLGSGQFKAELLAANELDDGVSGRIRLR